MPRDEMAHISNEFGTGASVGATGHTGRCPDVLRDCVTAVILYQVLIREGDIVDDSSTFFLILSGTVKVFVITPTAQTGFGLEVASLTVGEVHAVRLFWIHRIIFYYFCDRNVREKAWRSRTCLGRRASRSHTLAASQAFERMHMAFLP